MIIFLFKIETTVKMSSFSKDGDTNFILNWIILFSCNRTEKYSLTRGAKN